MSDEPKKRHWWRWALALVCLLVVIYVGGYFRLAEHPLFKGTPDSHVRIYPWNWVRRAYVPLAWIDAHINSRMVILRTTYDDQNSIWFDPNNE